MKTIIFLLLLLLQANAVILTYPDGKKEFFIEQDNKSRALNDRAYYKNGVVSKRTLFKDTRKIYVSFKELADIEKFKNKYNLIMLKETNEMFHTYLFEIKSMADVVELCSTINQQEEVRYAKPNWKSPRFTH
jgi:hypothetical protein